MRKIVVGIAVMCMLSACHSRRSQVVDTSAQSAAETRLETLCERIDTSQMVLSLEIDTPEVVIMRNDSITVKISGRKLQLNAQRKNAVSSGTAVQEQSTATVYAATAVSTKQSTNAATPINLLLWIAVAALAFLVFKLLKSKFSCK